MQHEACSVRCSRVLFGNLDVLRGYSKSALAQHICGERAVQERIASDDRAHFCIGLCDRCREREPDRPNRRKHRLEAVLTLERRFTHCDGSAVGAPLTVPLVRTLEYLYYPRVPTLPESTYTTREDSIAFEQQSLMFGMGSAVRFHFAEACRKVRREATSLTGSCA